MKYTECKKKLRSWVACVRSGSPATFSDYLLEAQLNERIPAGEILDGVTIVTAVMDRSDHLLQVLPTWLAHPVVKEIVILDWSSRKPLQRILRTMHDERIRIIRVKNQRQWVLSWAFNLAFSFARCPVLLKTDCDIVLSHDFFERHPLHHGEFYTGHHEVLGPGLSGLLLLHKDALRSVHGYNEHIETYGFDDYELYERLKTVGLRQYFFQKGTCVHLAHSDRMRLRRQSTFLCTREQLALRNRGRFSGKNSWNAIQSNLENVPGSHPVMIRRYRELDPAVFLQDMRGVAVDFFRVSGNWGDALIAEACVQMFRELGIPFHEKLRLEPQGKPGSSIAVVKGGGGLIDFYHHNRDHLMTIRKKYERIILLPSTIAGIKQQKLLRSMPETATIFCREKQSYDFVKDHWKYANTQLYLWHDTAFQFDYTGFKKEGTGLLTAFRTDQERTMRPLPPDNTDLSLRGNIQTPIAEFLQEIACKHIVHTNRLHVAIAAACLEKEVELHSNAYWKNRAVYEYSLQHFPHVRWMG